MLEKIEVRGIDQLMALMQQFRADPRERKVDLVVGVYKDDKGNVPIMAAVKQAEARILDTEDTKNYVGIGGDPALTKRVPTLLLGDASKPLEEGRIACVQTPGGGGALKVGSDLINRIRAGTRIWMSTPTWANHEPIAADAGLTIESYPYFRAEDRGLDFAGMITHLDARTEPGDVLLLHACCHNPTGVDLGPDDWQKLTELVVDRRVLPFVDCAYQGLGHGLDEDVAGLRYMAERVEEMLIASSFSKNFGIYRERCGALSVMSKTAEQTSVTMEALQTVIRSNYSMPPSHGARIVSTVFGDSDLTASWDAELTGMRKRIAAMRMQLRQKLEECQVAEGLSFITKQTGMFSYTGFTPDMVTKLRDDFGIYIAGDGRINVAGISSDNIDVIAEGFASVMR